MEDQMGEVWQTHPLNGLMQFSKYIFLSPLEVFSDLIDEM
jgi:hypothetical protein